ncbi:hypothetical protein GALMADRAFT_60406 [Galerina marginata CBS 339.88]|uniref:UEV domain-containing protein n=1 Tax=Galerina marginata (strain CBS 339.88) TaxID=685588 RepID=A0A067TNT8_GALM3|nr:hypothetical protein GALMADRAFT_60406 [Galerina marginata CBS 339.88]
MSSSLTQKWLRQTVQPYPNHPRVYADVDSVLPRFPTLRPKSDVYTFDDGRTQLLLCIHGLLPITYRQAAYNIPVAVWLPRDYPRQSPIAYVVPTNEMLVKPGKYVDVSGRCNIEYIQHWERKDEGRSLSALLEALQEHFSREPPVYSKPKDVSVNQTYADRPPPPLPSNRPSPVPQSSPPSRPSKPPSIQFQGYPPPNYPVGSIRESPHSFRADSPAVPPPPLLAYALPVSPPPPPPRPPAIPSYVSPPPHPFAAAPNYLPAPVAFTPEPPRPVPPHAPIPDLLDEDNGASAFVASSFPAPPPRPPNPELLRLQSEVHQKITSELNSLSQALALDAERLRAQQADLLAGEPAIKDEMARLEAVRDVCRSVANRTRQAVQQAESNITELRRKGDPEVDELVCATSIVHNQLINLIADDNAIEDTIYHLHRALNAGRIDLERFLRSTRVLAEEQFMKRALIEKIQTSMSTMPSLSMAPDWA